MSVVYLIDGRPHRLCDCDPTTANCPRGALRTLQTCGFSRCLVPAPDVLTASMTLDSTVKTNTPAAQKHGAAQGEKE